MYLKKHYKKQPDNELLFIVNQSDSSFLRIQKVRSLVAIERELQPNH
jgi:hypothetical protein